MNLAQAVDPLTRRISYERASAPEVLRPRLRAPVDLVVREHRRVETWGVGRGGVRHVRRPLAGATYELLAAICRARLPLTLGQVRALAPHVRESVLRQRLFALCERGDVLRSGLRRTFWYRAATPQDRR